MADKQNCYWFCIAFIKKINPGEPRSLTVWGIAFLFCIILSCLSRFLVFSVIFQCFFSWILAFSAIFYSCCYELEPFHHYVMLFKINRYLFCNIMVFDMNYCISSNILRFWTWMLAWPAIFYGFWHELLPFL